jgi:hypothetical protein
MFQVAIFMVVDCRCPARPGNPVTDAACDYRGR